MTKEERAAAAGESKDASLWRTAFGLSVLFLACLYFLGIESGMITAGVALLSMLVTSVGVLWHGLGGLWRAFKGRGPLARRSLSRTAMYLGFGLASLVAARLQGNAIDEFRRDLQPGTSLQEALRRLDVLYTGHPGRWRFISLWGTTKELALDDYPKIGAPGDSAVVFTWSAGEAHSTGVVADTAAALSKTRQVWFTFRTDVGFVHFFVILDERGLIKSVSGTTGHQA